LGGAAEEAMPLSASQSHGPTSSGFTKKGVDIGYFRMARYCQVGVVAPFFLLTVVDLRTAKIVPDVLDERFHKGTMARNAHGETG